MTTLHTTQTTQTTRTTQAPDLHLHLPTTWRRRRDPAHGVVLAARAPSVPPGGLRPEIVVRSAPAEGSLVGWRAAAMTELARLLDEFDLEDDDDFDLLGLDVAYRRFAHRVGRIDVMCDQWAWLVDGTGITLTCSVARDDYADYCDLFEAVAESVEVCRR